MEEEISVLREAVGRVERSKILELKENPASMEFAVRDADLAQLRRENEVLLARLDELGKASAVIQSDIQPKDFSETSHVSESATNGTVGDKENEDLYAKSGLRLFGEVMDDILQKNHVEFADATRRQQLLSILQRWEASSPPSESYDTLRRQNRHLSDLIAQKEKRIMRLKEVRHFIVYCGKNINV